MASTFSVALKGFRSVTFTLVIFVLGIIAGSMLVIYPNYSIPALGENRISEEMLMSILQKSRIAEANRADPSSTDGEREAALEGDYPERHRRPDKDKPKADIYSGKQPHREDIEQTKQEVQAVEEGEEADKVGREDEVREVEEAKAVEELETVEEVKEEDEGKNVEDVEGMEGVEDVKEERGLEEEEDGIDRTGKKKKSEVDDEAEERERVESLESSKPTSPKQQPTTVADTPHNDRDEGDATDDDDDDDYRDDDSDHKEDEETDSRAAEINSEFPDKNKNEKNYEERKGRTHEDEAASKQERGEVDSDEDSREGLRQEEISTQHLLQIFEMKLKNITGRGRDLGDTCFDKRTLSNSCDNGQCLQTKRPAAPKDRLKQLINRPGLILSDSQHALLREMAAQVTKKYDVILMTAASSNHFLESQALLQNIHQFVFPHLKNFALLFYDIGLTGRERRDMEKYCRCQVLSFPFHELPEYVQNLKCYAWKPVMIKAHIHQANVVLWLDASIRFNGDSDQLHLLIQRVKERGVQIGGSSADTAFRTFRSMFHYFGDEPCMYLGMGQAQATIGGYNNEPFVHRAILEPWVACALNQDCMCPANNLSAGCRDSKKMAENFMLHGGPIIYGMCHRFDQSAITLILHKLYQIHYRWVMMRVHEYGSIERDDEVNYFKTL
ncbi:hypothetical protein PoB_003413500 [Plakobranchus ocellatus]|uniref:Uncharacterized protein n=1 Tax=Plakobranchus ocellatus TaxID=259542 RepID=A0AAV4AHI8_9GAST|nr:hypothetical protein PoB_003413500 [Plakobranchus ocellatus]